MTEKEDNISIINHQPNQKEVVQLRKKSASKLECGNLDVNI